MEKNSTYCTSNVALEHIRQQLCLRLHRQLLLLQLLPLLLIHLQLGAVKLILAQKEK